MVIVKLASQTPDRGSTSVATTNQLSVATANQNHNLKGFFIFKKSWVPPKLKNGYVVTEIIAIVYSYY